MKKMITTAINIKNKNAELISGIESYPIQGNTINNEQYKEIMKRCQGLSQNWDCLEKAQIVKEVLGKGQVYIGSLLVWSNDFKSQFGYYFNPPLEFHAWVEIDENIIDIALPGVIEQGLNTVDHIGPVLVGRSPFVLAGIPERYLEYKKEKGVI